MTWTPRLDAALEEIKKIYPPGCIEHYGKQTPDPWQAEFDRLDSALSTLSNEAEVKRAIDVFESNCKALIEGFKK